MDPVTLILVPGFIGGAALAAIIFRLQRPDGNADHVRFPPTDVINAAHIRVAGVGGLGLVAMATAVALAVPRIRLTLAIGCVLGFGLAAALISYRRRRSGPLPSSGRSGGANTVLSIDAVPPAPGREDVRNQERLSTVPSPSRL
jgi:hypothetical protein